MRKSDLIKLSIAIITLLVAGILLVVNLSGPGKKIDNSTVADEKPPPPLIDSKGREVPRIERQGGARLAPGKK